jgi:hypothetical protein
MFTMRDYLVEAQRRKDEIARAQHHNLVKSLSPKGSRQFGRLLVRLGEGLVQRGRELQGSVAESSGNCSCAGRTGVSVA